MQKSRNNKEPRHMLAAMPRRDTHRDIARTTPSSPPHNTASLAREHVPWPSLGARDWHLACFHPQARTTAGPEGLEWCRWRPPVETVFTHTQDHRGGQATNKQLPFPPPPPPHTHHIPHTTHHTQAPYTTKILHSLPSQHTNLQRLDLQLQGAVIQPPLQVCYFGQQGLVFLRKFFSQHMAGTNHPSTQTHDPHHWQKRHPPPPRPRSTPQSGSLSCS